MRRKLTEIISTMDQYNGMGKYKDQYEGGEQVDICSDFPQSPDKATIAENLQQKLICDILVESNCRQKKIRELTVWEYNSLKKDEFHILSFDEYVKENYEIKPPRLSDADYDDRPKGWREDVWDEEDESENEEE